MLDPRDTRQEDLRTGTGPWRPLLQRPTGAILQADTRCDVAVVGGGITGALVAEHLTAMGRDPKLGGLRISIGFSTTEEDIDRAVAACAKIASRRRPAGEAA